MNVDDSFIRDAIDGAMKMLLIPFSADLVFVRLEELVIGVQMSWQDIARGVAMLIFLYVYVMWQRYRRYFH